MISDCFNLYYQYFSIVLGVFFNAVSTSIFSSILVVFQNILSSKTFPYMYINEIVKLLCFQDYHLNFHNYLMPSQFSVILYEIFFLHIYDSCSFVIVDGVVF